MSMPLPMVCTLIDVVNNDDDDDGNDAVAAAEERGVVKLQLSFAVTMF